MSDSGGNTFTPFGAADWAMRQTLPPRDKLVLIMLATFWHSVERHAWMGQGCLADRTGYSRKTVNEALAALEHEHGLIRSGQRHGSDGRKLTKRYWLGYDDFGGGANGGGRVTEGDKPSNPGLQAPVTESDSRDLDFRDLDSRTTTSRQSEPQEPPAKSAAPTRERIDYPEFQKIWNDHRGPHLPKVLTLDDKRRAAIAKLVKEHGIEEARALLRDATIAVSRDEFWRERRFTFDTLVPRKVLQHAERYRAAAPGGSNGAARSAEDLIGRTVRHHLLGEVYVFGDSGGQALVYDAANNHHTVSVNDLQ